MKGLRTDHMMLYWYIRYNIYLHIICACKYKYRYNIINEEVKQLDLFILLCDCLRQIGEAMFKAIPQKGIFDTFNKNHLALHCWEKQHGMIEYFCGLKRIDGIRANGDSRTTIVPRFRAIGFG